MFTIIGGDGKEYGPATVEQIRGWIAAGRANLDTKAKAVGSDEWRRLGDFAEFSATESVLPPVSYPGEVAAAEPLADPGTRLLCWLLDIVFSIIVTIPGAMLFGTAALTNLMRNPYSVPTEVSAKMALGSLLMFFGGLVLFVVQLWLLSTRGQTLAKRIFGIRIVNVADNTNPGFVRAVLLRWFVPSLITVLIPIFGLLFFVVDSCFVFRPDHRCIHDLIAGTKVVKA